jgi:hypothetical protein
MPIPTEVNKNCRPGQSGVGCAIAGHDCPASNNVGCENRHPLTDPNGNCAVTETDCFVDQPSDDPPSLDLGGITLPTGRIKKSLMRRDKDRP